MYDHRRTRLALWLTLFVALTTGVLVAAWPSAADERGRSLGAAAGAVPAPTTTQTTQTVPTLPMLPIPEALPDDPYEPTPQVVLGTIEIPKIDLVDELQQGMSLTAINRGPSWWPGTARPGELGNAVVAGHRTTYDRPFYRLHELAPGDEVIFTTAAGRFVYAVRDVIVVPEHWIDIAAQSHAHTATLFACHPIGSAAERIVAKLRLLTADGRPVDADAALPAIDAEAQRTDHTLFVRGRAEVVSGADPLTASRAP